VQVLVQTGELHFLKLSFPSTEQSLLSGATSGAIVPVSYGLLVFICLLGLWFFTCARHTVSLNNQLVRVNAFVNSL